MTKIFQRIIKQTKLKKVNSNEGFTLVEMLVSITLFSIVLVVMLGSILTIVDVNRKSQSLTVVMNDINFAMEAFTRSIKTGKLNESWLNSSCNDSVLGCGNVVVVNQDGEEVEYEFLEDNGRGYIQRSITNPFGEDEVVELTSNQIDIETAVFKAFYGGNNLQPRVLVLIDGIVQTGPRITSQFSIQTTISQRNLDENNL